MNTVKDFELNQRVQDEHGTVGTVSKIGRKYVHVQLDGTDKPTQFLPEQLSEVPALVDTASTPLDNRAPVGGRPPKRATAKVVDRSARRSARKVQKASRRKNRSR